MVIWICGVKLPLKLKDVDFVGFELNGRIIKRKI